VWDAIRSFKPEYNIQSFFRDLPKVRAKTFKPTTVKHAFRDSGIWPISFTQVQRKLHEYGKKKRKASGLDVLEFGSPEPDNSALLPTLENSTIPPLLPSTYHSIYEDLRSLHTKIGQALSLPTRNRFNSVAYTTGVLLIRGSLHKMEITQARQGAIAIHKKKLNARKSLSKGGQLYVFQAIDRIKEKRLKEADDTLKRAKKYLQVAENKLRHVFEEKGRKGRKEELARKRAI
jgi:hypothetical protein